ncbi:DUF6171 family protein [Ruminococcus sp. CLA-AA-H200]|uniref:DUF6171 family protein n=1 Tax=Ruminococcus turbiniformis TaxID=2881258 RepID=A0ABS8FX63_9FIRM|nr:DUF6171 family protein [Ruminococcus turbiniformis]MCC2254643.1 DUF6171 family protein [Ruminococcus turbiniformis]
MPDTQRICRKCLLRDMPEEAYFQNMYTYIANLSEDDRASDAEYERRLVLCRECDQLLNGMCRVCGCFVEMRAAIAVRHCPGVEKRW